MLPATHGPAGLRGIAAPSRCPWCNAQRDYTRPPIDSLGGFRPYRCGGVPIRLTGSMWRIDNCSTLGPMLSPPFRHCERT